MFLCQIKILLCDYSTIVDIVAVPEVYPTINFVKNHNCVNGLY